jgi:hypothetical protein
MEVLFLVFFFFFLKFHTDFHNDWTTLSSETGSHYVAQGGLELTIVAQANLELKILLTLPPLY